MVLETLEVRHLDRRLYKLVKLFQKFLKLILDNIYNLLSLHEVVLHGVNVS